MSGHSHWATIKRAKGAADAKKGKVFSKLGKEITIVVKAKGGDPNTNPTLRTLIAKAKAAQMPNDNIDRAIKKGTGELESAALVDAQYEGIKGAVADIETAQGALSRYFDTDSRKTQLLQSTLKDISSQSPQTLIPRPDDTLAALAAVSGSSR